MFYRATVRPGKPAVFVPPPDEHMLHLSQACLAHDVPEGTRASLLVQLDENEEPAVLCTLRAGGLDTVPLDQYFAHYCEFTVAGNAAIHLSGYYSPQQEEEDGMIPGEEDEDEDDDDYVHPMHPGMLLGESDDEFESDEDEDESDDEDEDSDDDAPPGWGRVGREPSAVIEEIEDEKKEKDAGKGKAGQQLVVAPKGQQLKQQQKQQEEEESSEEDSEDDEGEDSSDSEEEEKPQQKAGDKRKAEAPSTPATKKQATVAGKDAAKPHQQQQKQDKTPAGKQQAAAAAPAKTPQQQAAAAAKTPQQLAAAAKTPQQQQQQQQTPGSSKKAKPRIFENGFEIHELKMGQPDGRVAKAGKRVGMRYVGRLVKNGKVFDSNTKGKPFWFRLGVGEVIKGWDRGVEGMRVGDKRKLVIPPQMAYGTQKIPGIPPNSTLEFEVELVDVK